jgi:hypothetical protein
MKTLTRRARPTIGWAFIFLAGSPSGCVTSLTRVDYRSHLSDPDERAIVGKLFELELGAHPDGGGTPILLAPGTKLEWIPQIPGSTFRVLEYGERARVEQYYEVGLQGGRGFVEAWLVKGNNCGKLGHVYRFRADGGIWHGERTRTQEQWTVTSACPGCRLASTPISSLQRAWAEAEASERVHAGLEMRGQVLDSRCHEAANGTVACAIDLDLEFINNGSRPAILLRPFGEHVFWFGGKTLAVRQDGREHLVHDTGAWPSVYPFAEYRELADKLDKPTPPPDVTTILLPGGTWRWRKTITHTFPKENTCSTSVGLELGWRDIRAFSSPALLRVSFEMWPFNVENFKPRLGQELRRRWREYGDLYLQEEHGRYGFAHITSEAIEWDLRRVEGPP